jgi:hypothetical protein
MTKYRRIGINFPRRRIVPLPMEEGRRGRLSVTPRPARLARFPGARTGLQGQDVPDVVRQQLGLCLISSPSFAVGLTIQIRSAFPAYAATITGIVLAAVVIFEVVGPLRTRRALFATGDE